MVFIYDPPLTYIFFALYQENRPDPYPVVQTNQVKQTKWIIQQLNNVPSGLNTAFPEIRKNDMFEFH